MRAKNLDDVYGTPVQDWTSVTTVLDNGVTQAPDTGGPDRHTTWLATINRDGTPHVTAVGAVWVDDAFWFQTGDGTRKAKNVARDERCTISVSTKEFDLVVDGTAEKVSDPADVAGVAAVWVAGAGRVRSTRQASVSRHRSTLRAWVQHRGSSTASRLARRRRSRRSNRAARRAGRSDRTPSDIGRPLRAGTC